MTMYKITDKNNLLQIRNNNTRFILYLSITMLWMAIIFLFLFIYVGISRRYTGADYYIGVISILGAVIVLFGFFIWGVVSAYYLYKKKWLSWATYIEIDNTGLTTISANKKKKLYKYSFFDNSIVRLEIYDRRRKIKPKLIYYTSFYEFLMNMVKDIEAYISPYQRISDFNATISIYKRGTSKPYLSLTISLEVIGGIENIKEMCDDLREKYEEYLKTSGKYKQVIKRTEKEKREKSEATPRKARIHFYTLTGIIIFAVLSFVFLPVLTLLNTPRNSPEYDTWFNFLIIDGLFTIWLIIIGFAKLPKLYKEGWKDRRCRDEI